VPEQQWFRLHVDFAGQFPNGSYLFVLVDVTSKWPEIFRLQKITSATTITTLKTIFFPFWFATRIGDGQWPPIYFRRVQAIYADEWHRQPYGSALQSTEQRIS
jgi:hypothetical protein